MALNLNSSYMIGSGMISRGEMGLITPNGFLWLVIKLVLLRPHFSHYSFHPNCAILVEARNSPAACR